MPSKAALSPSPAFHGVLVVDKARGPTSHDIVAMARRVFGTRAVGHTGTLDPTATGVLVLTIGEARKLVQFLIAEEKEYEVEVLLGHETDSHDSEGVVVAEAPVPAGLDVDAAFAATRRFLGTTTQVPPALSAVKVGGQPLYARVRRGEDVRAPERAVFVRALEILAVEGPRVRLHLVCGSGFYARSLARDMALALGTKGHLFALRRARSGAFGLERAVSEELLRRALIDDDAREEVRGRLVPLTASCVSMPRVELSDEGCDMVRNGRAVPESVLAVLPRPQVPQGAPLALVSPGGRLVAIGRRRGRLYSVLRGIHDGEP